METDIVWGTCLTNVFKSLFYPAEKSTSCYGILKMEYPYSSFVHKLYILPLCHLNIINLNHFLSEILQNCEFDFCFCAVVWVFLSIYLFLHNLYAVMLFVG